MIAQSDDVQFVDPIINEVVIQNENKTHTEVSDQQNDSMQYTPVKGNFTLKCNSKILGIT